MKKIIMMGVLLTMFNERALSCIEDIKVNNMQLLPISVGSILNGSSIDIFQLASRKCNVSCYMNYLDNNNVKFSKQGTLLYLEKKGGITIQLLNNNDQGFSGRVICKSRIKNKLIPLPDFIKIPKPSTDFQSADKGGVSRTLVVKGYSKDNYLNQLNILKLKAKNSDINTSYSYFELLNGDEVNLIYDTKKLIGNLLIIFVKKS